MFRNQSLFKSQTMAFGFAALVAMASGCSDSDSTTVVFRGNNNGFAPGFDVATQAGPSSTAVADFNGDAINDVAAANSGDTSVSIIVNDAFLSLDLRVDLDVGAPAVRLATADLNNDGLADLAVVKTDTNVAILMNTTPDPVNPPSFQQTDVAGAPGVFGIALGDLDNDGNIDVVTANRDDNSFSVFQNQTIMGDTAPTFAARVDFSTGNAPVAVALGDLNQDGFLDIVTANSADDSIGVFLNTTGDGPTITFGEGTAQPTGANPVSVAIGDLNNLGGPEIVVATADANAIDVLTNDTDAGADTFAVANTDTVLLGINPVAVLIGPLTPGNNNDIAVINADDNSLTLIENVTDKGGNGGATIVNFRPGLTTGANPSSLAIGDLSGNGRTDIVVSNTDDNNVRIFLGQ